jgi:hypothetical protein
LITEEFVQLALQAIAYRTSFITLVHYAVGQIMAAKLAQQAIVWLANFILLQIVIIPTVVATVAIRAITMNFATVDVMEICPLIATRANLVV